VLWIVDHYLRGTFAEYSGRWELAFIFPYKGKNRERFRKNEQFLPTSTLRMAQGSFGVGLQPRTLYLAIEAMASRPLP
jgi:hypothetical protein